MADPQKIAAALKFYESIKSLSPFGMPNVADIYSTIGSLKRKGADFIQNPIESAQQMVGNANDQARALNQLTAESAQEGLSFGPKTKLLASQLAEGYNPTGMTVYHGSPYKFSKFDANKIGTGEGAQAYGYNASFEYPQQDALNLAQKRAALPKSESGLGLPTNNTPEMRYQAMKGVEGNFVHGSKNPDIEKFKTRKQIFEESANDPNRAIAENHYANERNAVFASSDPEFTTAFSQHGYTDVGQAPTSYPLRMIGGNKVFDFENPSHLDMLKQKYAEMFPVKTIGREGYVPSEESIRMHTINKRIENLPNDTNNWPAIESQDFQKAIRELGFDAFHVNERGTKNIGVYDPSSLRSPFAAYDPFRKDVATAIAMGVALPDLLAAEKENKQKK
jgi:hypothetical protein